MASPVSPLRVIAREILADGAWHRFLDVQVALMPHVEPSIALRKCEEARLRKAERRGGSTERIRDRSVEDRIYSGRLAIAHRILIYKRDFQTRVDEDGDKYIRLRPRGERTGSSDVSAFFG